MQLSRSPRIRPLGPPTNAINHATPRHRSLPRMLPMLAMVSIIAGILLVGASPALAATFSNACINSAVPTDFSQVEVTLTGTAPASVAPGASFQLTDINQTLVLPGAIFVAGYNLGLLVVGANTVPGTVRTVIEGTNTVEGTQTTPATAVSLTFTITDPDGTPGTGDETGTDPIVTVTYANQTWTAGPAGAIAFREDTVTPQSATVAGILVTATIGGFLTVRFGCNPGIVNVGPPETITLTDPAVPFASTVSAAANSAPTASAGPDQSVASGASVGLNGAGSTDPDLDSLTYAWSQTTGPIVTLSSASAVAPTFTAPTGPTSLTFNLQVCDPSNACATDSVTITVAAPAPAPTPAPTAAPPAPTAAPPTPTAAPPAPTAAPPAPTVPPTSTATPQADPKAWPMGLAMLAITMLVGALILPRRWRTVRGDAPAGRARPDGR